MQKSDTRPNIISRLFQSNVSAGILTLACVVASLIIANTTLGPSFEAVLNRQLGIEGSNIHLRYSLQSWINDGLMAIFFLMVGLEIKREILEGDLSTRPKAMLPVLCAFGGAIVPALIYFTINKGLPTQGGWGIPMATDIAFAVAIIALLSKRLPPSLKIFLTALAIADDLLAILVIALFYAGHIHAIYLLFAALVAVLLFLFNRLGLTGLVWYLVPGLLMWYFIHHSGIHATIAGVITALFVPIQSKSGLRPLEKLEHALASPVNFIIIPLFALANTNIRFEEGMTAGLISPTGLGIMIGLIVGKPIGILLTALLGTSTGLCHLPEAAGWRHIIGAGILAGIGFTMSIFITLLSFSDHLLIGQAKFAVLAASLTSAIAGYWVLRSGAKA